MSERFTAQLFLDGVQFDIDLDFTPGEFPTEYEPGTENECECAQISFAGTVFNVVQEEQFIMQYGEDEFEEWLQEEADNYANKKRDTRDQYWFEGAA